MCQLQLHISFPLGMQTKCAKCFQHSPGQETVSDLPPSASGDNEIKASDLLGRKERARAGFVAQGITCFGRETQAKRY